MNLFQVVERAAAQWPDATAIVQGDRVLSYKNLHEVSCKLAAKLASLGVTRGNKVCIVFPRSIEYVIACFAVLKVGAIAVSMSSILKPEEIAAAVADTGIDAFCYHADLHSVIFKLVNDGTTGLSPLSEYPAVLIARAENPSPDVSVRQRLLTVGAAYICFSSGTTSTSKGIVLSHEALYERANRRMDAPKTTQSSSILWLRAFDRFVPNQIVAAFMLGARVVIGNSLDRSSHAKLIKQHGVNQVWAVPSFYRSLLQDSVPAADYEQIPDFLSSGAPLPVAVSQAFQEKFHREILQNYGSAECSPIFINPATHPHKRGSVGMPVQGREVKLRAFDAGGDSDPSEGELLVRGAGMVTAYFKPWRTSEQFLENGWLPTGDIARRDEDGYYWIVGRIKEVINVGGTKVFANEIEEILLRHPLVDDCVVFGAPDPRFGEVPNAKVKLRHEVAETDLLSFVNDRVSVFKSIRKLEIVDRIEKTATGKPKRWLYRLVTLPAPFVEMLSTAARCLGVDSIL